MDKPAQSVGIFGLGLIGSAIAGRLMAAGHAVIGHDPNPASAAAFESQCAPHGGRIATPDGVWSADVVISCVFDTDQLAGLIAGAPICEGATLISLSTCDPERMAGLARDAAARGITLIEAPISGTSKALAQGDVLLLVAGDGKVIDGLTPIFETFSRAHLNVGTIGNGNRAKLAINLVLGLNRAALAEGMVFAEALGLDGRDFLAMAQASAAQSAVMQSKGALMVAREFAPQGRIVQSAKDFSLIRNSAAAAGQGLPFAETYMAMMRDAMAQGEGELDNSAILLPIARTPPPKSTS